MCVLFRSWPNVLFITLRLYIMYAYTSCLYMITKTNSHQIYFRQCVCVVSTDTWTSCTLHGYITVTCRFQDKYMECLQCGPFYVFLQLRYVYLPNIELIIWKRLVSHFRKLRFWKFLFQIWGGGSGVRVGGGRWMEGGGGACSDTNHMIRIMSQHHGRKYRRSIFNYCVTYCI